MSRDWIFPFLSKQCRYCARELKSNSVMRQGPRFVICEKCKKEGRKYPAIEFIKDVRNYYKRIPNDSRRIPGVPLVLLFMFCPLFVVLTVVTWFDVKIFLGTIVIFAITGVFFQIIVKMEREYKRKQMFPLKRKI